MMAKNESNSFVLHMYVQTSSRLLSTVLYFWCMGLSIGDRPCCLDSVQEPGNAAAWEDCVESA